MGLLVFLLRFDKTSSLSWQATFPIEGSPLRSWLGKFLLKLSRNKPGLLRNHTKPPSWGCLCLCSWQQMMPMGCHCSSAPLLSQGTQALSTDFVAPKFTSHRDNSVPLSKPLLRNLLWAELDNLSDNSDDSVLCNISAFPLELWGEWKEGGEGGSGASWAGSQGGTFPNMENHKGIVSKSSLLMKMDKKAVSEWI